MPISHNFKWGKSHVMTYSFRRKLKPFKGKWLRALVLELWLGFWYPNASALFSCHCWGCSLQCSGLTFRALHYLTPRRLLWLKLTLLSSSYSPYCPKKVWLVYLFVIHSFITHILRTYHCQALKTQGQTSPYPLWTGCESSTVVPTPVMP